MKITDVPSSAARENPDKFLPVSQVCFWSIGVPRYTTKEICLDRLVYAISHADLMDADYIVRDESKGWSEFAEEPER